METPSSVNDISEALCEQSIEPGAKKIKIYSQSSGVTQSVWGKGKYAKKYCKAANTGSKQEVEDHKLNGQSAEGENNWIWRRCGRSPL